MVRVLVAGATGVIGRQLLPLLTASGHEVVALSRRPSTDSLGVTSMAVDVLDHVALNKAVRTATPDAVVHLATAVPPAPNPRKMDQEFALTNRLRNEGTRNLIAAAREVEATQVITQ